MTTPITLAWEHLINLVEAMAGAGDIEISRETLAAFEARVNANGNVEDWALPSLNAVRELLGMDPLPTDEELDDDGA
ncbi:MAG: hypothetical protein AAGE05_04315 [Pseudomonadota bacterium]